jgi:hypothetical protein
MPERKYIAKVLNLLAQKLTCGRLGKKKYVGKSISELQMDIELKQRRVLILVSRGL